MHAAGRGCSVRRSSLSLTDSGKGGSGGCTSTDSPLSAERCDTSQVTKGRRTVQSADRQAEGTIMRRATLFPTTTDAVTGLSRGCRSSPSSHSQVLTFDRLNLNFPAAAISMFFLSVRHLSSPPSLGDRSDDGSRVSHPLLPVLRHLRPRDRLLLLISMLISPLVPQQSQQHNSDSFLIYLHTCRIRVVTPGLCLSARLPARIRTVSCCMLICGTAFPCQVPVRTERIRISRTRPDPEAAVPDGGEEMVLSETPIRQKG